MGLLRNINYLKRLQVIPCGQPDWWVIVETGLEAAPPALLTLFLPGCTDILKVRIGRSPWHARSIRSLIKGAIKPLSAGQTKFLYRIGYETAEKYLWWLMVADVTQEFLTTWASMIYQQQQCQLPGAGTASGIFAPFIYEPEQAGALQWNMIHPVFGVVEGLNEINILPGFTGAIAYGMQWDSWPERGKGVSVECSLEQINDGTVSNEQATNDPVLNNGTGIAGHIFESHLGNIVPEKYRVNFVNTGDTYAQIVQSSWSIGLSGRKTGNLIWGCDLKPVEWPFPNPLG